MYTITSNEDALAKVARIFSLYHVNDNSFNPRISNPDRFSLKDWNFLTDLLLKEFHIDELNPTYSPITLHNDHTPKVESLFQGGYVNLNEKQANVFFTDISIIEIESAYPTSVINTKRRIKLNYLHYLDLYEFLIKNRKTFRQIYHSTDPNLYMVYKYYINMLYGCVLNPKSLIRLSTDSIPLNQEICNILKNIQTEFKFHIPYIDTDSIFVHKLSSIQDSLEQILIDKKYSFEVKGTYEGIFIAKKKYVLFNQNERIVKGIQTNKIRI